MLTVATGVRPPGRTAEQREAALERANEIRSHRAGVKRKVAAGQLRAWDVIRSEDPRLATMTVYDVLLAVPKVGRVKLSKAFVRANVSASRTVGAIQRRQLEALALQLGQWPGVRRAVFSR